MLVRLTNSSCMYIYVNPAAVAAIYQTGKFVRLEMMGTGDDYRDVCGTLEEVALKLNGAIK